MPKVNAKKIKWGLSLLVIGIIAIVFTQFNQKPEPQQLTISNCGLSLNSGCIALERVNTNPQRMLGLSGRDSLPKDSGMVFIFENASEQCFWMKDMKFNIDMIWLDANKKVTQIKADVSPDTYPNSFCASDTQYVIELASNEAQNRGIEVGRQLRF